MRDPLIIEEQSTLFSTGQRFETVTGDLYRIKKTALFSDLGQSEKNKTLYIKQLPAYFNHPTATKILQHYIDKINQYEANNKVALHQNGGQAVLAYHLQAGGLLIQRLARQSSTLSYRQIILLLKTLQQKREALSAIGMRHASLELNSIYMLADQQVYFLDQVIVSAKQALLSSEIIPWTTVPNAEALTASPTICFGREIQDQDEVYNLAILAYQLLSKRLPYGKKNSVQALLEKRKPIRIKGLKNAEWAILRKGLALEPQNRFLSPKTLLNLLLHRSNKEPQSLVEQKKEKMIPKSISLAKMKHCLPCESSISLPSPLVVKKNSLHGYKKWLLIPAGLGFFMGLLLMSHYMK